MLRGLWALTFAATMLLLVGAGSDVLSGARAETHGPVPSSNPLSGDPEAIEKGRRLFNTWCTQCHGGKADGVSRFGKYAADLRKFSKGFSEFAGIVVEGRADRMMPPWGDVLDGEQIMQIGAYLETLAIEGANWKDRY